MSKYHAKKTVVDGITFASKREAARYQELKLLERAGDIVQLQLQPAFLLCVPHANRAPIVVGKYLADFAYRDMRTRELVYEDVKGVKTAVYKLKKRMVEAQYGITISEV